MPNRIFQNVIQQLRESTGRTVGIIDSDGTVVACDDHSLEGMVWGNMVEPINDAEGSVVTMGGRSFKALDSWGSQFDYAGFIEGEDAEAQALCSVAVVAMNGAKQSYEEKHDKGTFLKNVISDNILLGDIYVRAKELHLICEAFWAVLLVRKGEDEYIEQTELVDAIQARFPARQTDFVLPVNDSDVAIIKQVPEEMEDRYLDNMARELQTTLDRELELKVVVGIGTVVNNIRELARSYKEAQLAIEVGKVFETERTIVNYENLGIGRLIYQLPTTLCEMFLNEVFKKNPIDSLDYETLFTINKFFENNLNVSVTARKLFVHRNTLVYRLEKIKKLTGLDLREFDDAITFKVALMVKKYLVSRGIVD